MSKSKDTERKLYVADFETTVDDDPTQQTETEVWSAAICPVIERPEPNDVTVYNNIYEFINHLEYNIEDDSIVFFHNEKFDISFLLNELNREGFVPAMSWDNNKKYAQDWQQKMTTNTYKVSVSSLGQWYSCTIRFENKTIEIRDSAKKIPSTLEEMGKSFHTKYQKLTMQYESSARKPFQVIPKEEMDYIINDVLVLAEAMYIVWYKYNMKGITIGADCLAEFKAIKGKEYDILFPDMTECWLDEQGCPEHINAYQYVLNSYSGGWCWQNPVSRGVLYKSDIQYPDYLQEKFDRLASKQAHLELVKNIVVVDVNSLYPSSMHAESGNYYPIGTPTWHKGQPTKTDIKKTAVIRRFKCRFKLKKGYLPFIHVRGTTAYNANDCLTTSDVRGSRYYKGRDGVEHDTLREYTMTQPEFDLFQKHYTIMNYEPIDYLTFEKAVGIFDDYIDKYRKMKIEATEKGDKAMRQIAKLYLNNLYGKLATSTNSSYKLIRFEEGVMKFDTVTEYEKCPVYIPAGAYVTAWARKFTISAGQLNYFEGEHKGVMYSDTDSLHLVDVNPDELKGIPFHATDFCKWACEESSCAYATYAKQKTYIEVATEEDFKTVTDKEGNMTYNLIVKAAGLGKEGKNLFTDRLFLDTDDPNKVYLDQFRPGLKLDRANLKAKQVKGGIVLVPSEFKLS